MESGIMLLQGTKRVYSFLSVMLVLVICASTSIQAQNVVEVSLDSVCKACLDKHYQSARDHIIKVWTVVDLLRTMSITPEARATFAHQMFVDIVIVMHDMAALVSSCHFCTDYYRRHSSDLLYLHEILGYVTEAFSAVFTPVLKGEEKLLMTIMADIAHSMDQIQQKIKNM